MRDSKSISYAAILLFLTLRPSQFGRAESYAFRDLGNWGAPTAVNNLRHVVGTSVGGERTSSFLYIDGLLTRLDIAGAANVFAYSINNENQIAGYFERSGAPTAGFVYEDGVTTPITLPGAAATRVYGMNDVGVTVGQFTEAGRISGFLFSEGTVQTVNAPGALITQPRAVNNVGQVAGYYTLSDGHQVGFVYRDGLFEPINVPGSSDTFVYGINNSGEVVGTYVDDIGTHGFSVANGLFSAVDSPDALPSSGTFVRGVNDSGDLVGSAPRAFLAEPVSSAVPEPRSSLLVGLGVTLVTGALFRVSKSSRQVRAELRSTLANSTATPQGTAEFSERS